MLSAGLSGVTQADAQFGVNLLEAQYTTYVWMEGTNGGTGASHTTTSPVPIGDQMYGPVSGLLCAQADAGMYQVSAFTGPGYLDGRAGANQAEARAETRILFSPLASGTANVEFDFFGRYSWFFSDGAASLVDVTANQTLWDSPWTFGGPLWQNNDPSNGTASGIISFPTEFAAGHTYALDMYVRTIAANDVEQVSVQLSGIQVIPEPAAFAVVGLGLAGFLAVRHRGGVRQERDVRG